MTAALISLAVLLAGEIVRLHLRDRQRNDAVSAMVAEHGVEVQKLTDEVFRLNEERWWSAS